MRPVPLSLSPSAQTCNRPILSPQPSPAPFPSLFLSVTGQPGPHVSDRPSLPSSSSRRPRAGLHTVPPNPDWHGICCLQTLVSHPYKDLNLLRASLSCFRDPGRALAGFRISPRGEETAAVVLAIRGRSVEIKWKPSSVIRSRTSLFIPSAFYPSL